MLSIDSSINRTGLLSIVSSIKMTNVLMYKSCFHVQTREMYTCILKYETNLVFNVKPDKYLPTCSNIIKKIRNEKAKTERNGKSYNLLNQNIP